MLDERGGFLCSNREFLFQILGFPPEANEDANEHSGDWESDVVREVVKNVENRFRTENKDVGVGSLTDGAEQEAEEKYGDTPCACHVTGNAEFLDEVCGQQFEERDEGRECREQYEGEECGREECASGHLEENLWERHEDEARPHTGFESVGENSREDCESGEDGDGGVHDDHLFGDAADVLRLVDIAAVCREDAHRKAKREERLANRRDNDGRFDGRKIRFAHVGARFTESGECDGITDEDDDEDKQYWHHDFRTGFDAFFDASRVHEGDKNEQYR